MTTPIDKVLPLLERVRQTRPGRWMACCPAHEDRSPSLGIAELDDDRVLINCRAGCSVVEVLRGGIKRAIVAAACRGFPATWAHWLIKRGGLRDA